MPTIEIDGLGKIEVAPAFDRLTPEQQDIFVSEIIRDAQAGKKSGLGGMPKARAAAPVNKPVMADTLAGTAADVGRSALSGLARGAVGLTGLPGDALRWGEYLADSVAQAPGRLYNRAVNGTWDMPEFMQDGAAMAENSRLKVGPQDILPGGADMVRKAEGVVGPFHEPQTKAGQYARTVGEFMPAAALGPGSIARKAVGYGAIPAVASESAGQLTEGTAAEPYARAGAAIGAGAAAAFGTIPRYSERMVGAAAQNVTPQQFDFASRLMQEARQRGITLTADEAVQAATNGATRLGDVRRIVESTTDGAERMAPAMSARPDQMRAAVGAELDRMSPTPPRPYDIAPQVQEVGVQAMQAAERLRTNRASPYYRAAESERINPNAVRAVSDQMEAAAGRDATGILAGPVNEARGLLVATPARPAQPGTRTPVTGPNGQVIRYESTPARPGVAETLINDIGNLDRARKFLRDRTELPPFAAQAIPKEEGRVIGGLLSNLRDRMEANSRNFATGRQQSENAARNIVEPMTNSPTGLLARAETPEAQRGILFPANPLPNSQRAIGNAIESIANRDPGLARTVVRQEAERVANKTVGGLDSAGRPDQFGGAKMAREMRSNPQRAVNFDEALNRAGLDAASANRLLDVLQATGWRQRPGSLTAFNQEALQDMKRGGLQAAVQTALGPLRKAGDAVARARLGRQADAVADILLSGPEGVAAIERLARQGRGVSNVASGGLLAGYPALRE